MSAVLVVTEQEGVARVWYRDGEGGLTQTAQVLVGETRPEQLAIVAADMHEHFNWARVVKARATPKPEALPQPVKRKRSQDKEPRLKRTAVEIAAYDDEVIGVIAARPGITVPDISRTIHGDANKRWNNNVRAALMRLENRRLITRNTSGSGPNDPVMYQVIAPETFRV